MSRRCSVLNKSVLFGNLVSHSNRKTKMRQYPNLRTKRLFDETSGQWITLKVSASGMRNITKLGLKKALAAAK